MTEASAAASNDNFLVEYPHFDAHVDRIARRVQVVGDLDIATVPHMVSAAASLQTTLPHDITIDLNSVTFIGAGAFGALVGLSNLQHVHGVRLHVIANDRVRWVASLCGLLALLASHPRGDDDQTDKAR